MKRAQRAVASLARRSLSHSREQACRSEQQVRSERPCAQADKSALCSAAAYQYHRRSRAAICSHKHTKTVYEETVDITIILKYTWYEPSTDYFGI